MLADAYGVDRRCARLAGFLHDWDKGYDDAGIRARVKELGLDETIDPWVVENMPQVLHGMTAAAALAREHPDIPADVIQAIDRHTTAAVDMTPLDMVVYVADAIEDGRRFGRIDELRAAVGKVDLEELFFETYRYWVFLLLEHRRQLHPATITVWMHMRREPPHGKESNDRQNRRTGRVSRTCAIIAARAADEKKATDIMVQEVRDLIGVTDYFVIVTASNSRQVDAIIDEIEEKLREDAQIKPLHREVSRDGSWSLLDYGNIVVHVFMPETREYYRLEALWNDAPVIDLAAEAGLDDLRYSDRIAKMLGKAKRRVVRACEIKPFGLSSEGGNAEWLFVPKVCNARSKLWFFARLHPMYRYVVCATRGGGSAWALRKERSSIEEVFSCPGTWRAAAAGGRRPSGCSDAVATPVPISSRAF